MSGPLRRTTVNVVAWLAGAAVSVSVGVLALAHVDDGLATAEVRPLSPDSVTRVVSASPSPGRATHPVPTGTPDGPRTRHPASAPHRSAAGPASPRVTERTFTAQGGSILVRCSADRVYLVSWSPAPGYRAVDVERGPAAEAELTFVGEHREVEIELRCEAGVPEATISLRTRRDDDGNEHHRH